LKVCSDIAAGMRTKRRSKLAGPGRHDTIAAATKNPAGNAQQNLHSYRPITASSSRVGT